MAAKTAPKKKAERKKAAPKASQKVVKRSKIEKIKDRIAAVDTKAKRKKELAEVPKGTRGLFHHLEASGTGKDKLDFLLSLDFGEETDQVKIAELAAEAFDDAGYSLVTITKILDYAETAGSKI